MHSPRFAFVLALAALGALPLAASCGGEEIGSGGSPDAGDEGVVGGHDSEPEETTTFIDSPGEDCFIEQGDAPNEASEGDSEAEGGVSCKETASSGSAGPGGACSTMVAEKCSSGYTYQVSCTCPKASCDCMATSGSSSMGQVGAHYSGCSSACGDDSLAWAACGYPQ
jgi:hypothetical protein